MFIKPQSKWIFVCLGLLALFLSSEGFRGYWDKKKYFKKLSKDLEDLRKINKDLEVEIERIKKDPTLYGDYARRELGLAKPGEIEYRFIAPEAEPQKK